MRICHLHTSIKYVLCEPFRASLARTRRMHAGPAYDQAAR